MWGQNISGVNVIIFCDYAYFPLDAAKYYTLTVTLMFCTFTSLFCGYT